MEAYYLAGLEKRGKKVVLGIWLGTTIIFIIVFSSIVFNRINFLWLLLTLILLFLLNRIAYLDIQRIMKFYRKRGKEVGGL